MAALKLTSERKPKCVSSSDSLGSEEKRGRVSGNSDKHASECSSHSQRTGILDSLGKKVKRAQGNREASLGLFFDARQSAPEDRMARKRSV